MDRTHSVVDSDAESLDDAASTRAIYHGTTGKHPKVLLPSVSDSWLNSNVASLTPSDNMSTRSVYSGVLPTNGIPYSGRESPPVSTVSLHPSTPSSRLISRSSSYLTEHTHEGGGMMGRSVSGGSMPVSSSTEPIQPVEFDFGNLQYRERQDHESKESKESTGDSRVQRKLKFRRKENMDGQGSVESDDYSGKESLPQAG